MARTEGPAGLEGLDELGGEWAGWAVSMIVTLGYAAYCAWQLRGCFVQALDVARGWRLAARKADEALQAALSAAGGDG